MKYSIQKVLAAILGVFLSAVGVAFNNSAGLGNDPVGIFYDGIRNALGLTTAQLGLASNIVNVSLVILLLILARKYISIGTLIYFLPYGFFVTVGNNIYQILIPADTIPARILFSIAGCLTLYIGIAICITADIGVDPFTGIVLYLTEKLKKPYRTMKILFDITLILIGLLLGGTPGVVTLFTAFLGGPLIQFFINIIKKYVLLHNKTHI